MAPISLASFAPFLGAAPTDAALAEFISTLTSSSSSSASVSQSECDVKTYPDATYHNYYSLALSLCFLPSSSSSALELDSVDIFNPSAEPPRRSGSKAPTYAAPPPLSIHFADSELVFPPRKAGEKEVRVPRDPLFEVVPATTGREIVRRFGEPSRKGAGGWIGVWLEWADVPLLLDNNRVLLGVMLELKDPKGAEEVSDEQKQKGMGGLWDRAAFWRWGSIKVFRTKNKDA